MPPPPPDRQPLTRERVLQTAIALADSSGLHALSMRKIGRELGVEAMSLYNHVSNKEDVLDGIVDLVVGEVEPSDEGADWRTALRQRAISTYRVQLRHPWAVTLLESRTHVPSRMRDCNTVIGVLRGADFSIRQAYHAFLTLDSYVYGFSLQEVNWPGDKEELPERLEEYQSQLPVDEFPHIAEMVRFALLEGPASSATPPEEGYAPEFEFGLDLILDGLERMRDGG